MALTVTQIQQLYTAYLGRAVDQEGVDYWTDAELDLTVADLRFNLANENQPEYVELYGNLSREDLVKAIYQNMFNRPADDDGLAYWTTGEGSVVPANELQQLFIEAASDEDKAAFEAEVQADLEEYEAGDTSELTEALAQLVEAQGERADAVEELETAVDASVELSGAATISYAPTAFTGTTAEELEIYSADAAALVAEARNDLAVERQGTSDQALRDEVAREQQLINADTAKSYNAAGATGTDFTARDLQVRAESALAAVNAHVSNNGTDLALASQLQSAISQYLNVAPDVTGGLLSAVNTEYDNVLTALAVDPVNPTDVESALVDWKGAVDAALDEVFTTQTNRADYDADDSTLNDVAAAAGLEQALLLANQRFALQEDAIVKEFAFSGVTLDLLDATAVLAGETAGTVGVDLRADEALLEARNDLIDLLASARDAEAAVNGSIEAFQAAETKLAEAAETLGYEVEEVDNGFEYGTDEADLFLFGEDTPTTVIISDFSADDALYLGSEVVQGDLESADNNQLEFFISSNAAGDAVVQVENTAFGSASENFTEITLTGVSADSLNVDGGLITVVEAA